MDTFISVIKSLIGKSEEIKKDVLKDKISLCESCHCMTKTIRGRCGKCNILKDEEIKHIFKIEQSGKTFNCFCGKPLRDPIHIRKMSSMKEFGRLAKKCAETFEPKWNDNHSNVSDNRKSGTSKSLLSKKHGKTKRNQ